MTNEDSQPGHRKGRSNGAAGGGEGDPQIISVGLAIQAFGAALAEHGRLSRKLTRAQRAAAWARLVPIARGFSGDLDTLIIGLQAEVRRNT